MSQQRSPLGGTRVQQAAGSRQAHRMRADCTGPARRHPPNSGASAVRMVCRRVPPEAACTGAPAWLSRHLCYAGRPAARTLSGHIRMANGGTAGHAAATQKTPARRGLVPYRVLVCPAVTRSGLLCKQEVAGSIPAGSTSKRAANTRICRDCPPTGSCACGRIVAQTPLDVSHGLIPLGTIVGIQPTRDPCASTVKQRSIMPLDHLHARAHDPR